MRIHSSKILVLFAMFVLFAGAPAVGGLLANHGFASSFDAWTKIEDAEVDAEWQATDADQNPGSGSVVISNRSADGTTAIAGLFQCVQVVPSAGYRIEADVREEPGAIRLDGESSVLLVWYANDACTGNDISTSTVADGEVVGEWVHLDEAVTAPPTARSAAVLLFVFKLQAGGSREAAFDNVQVAPTSLGPCQGDERTLCLAGDRFAVTARWRLPDGDQGDGRPQRLTGDSGTFWFFTAANVEVIVKLIDACDYNDRFWVFASGLTNVAVEITITDLAAGTAATYTNPQGTHFETVLDADALDTCP